MFWIVSAIIIAGSTTFGFHETRLVVDPACIIQYNMDESGHINIMYIDQDNDTMALDGLTVRKFNRITK